MTPEPLDALVVAAHPDDAEFAMGGTLLRLTDAGRRVGVLDLTRGERGTSGDADTRAREAAAASERAGLAWRGNLGLPDARLEATVEAAEELASRIRVHRPRLVFAHAERGGAGEHPDHEAAGALARRAAWLAGLESLAAERGEGPWRPARLYRFAGRSSFPAGEASFVVDVTAVWERRVELARSFATQLTPATGDVLARLEREARWWGARIGVERGEPFAHDGPLPAVDPLFG